MKSQLQMPPKLQPKPLPRAKRLQKLLLLKQKKLQKLLQPKLHLLKLLLPKAPLLKATSQPRKHQPRTLNKNLARLRGM